MATLQQAYIVAATRSPIGKAPRGIFSHTRPDDLLATVIQGLLAQVPGLDPAAIEDAIVGCAIPEGPQGLNVGRIGALLSGLPSSVRSEEHTSELQSLMRISYAVFCLKKKN